MEGGSSDRFSMSETSQRKKDAYLAYEHEYTIDTPEDHLSEAYKTTLDACVRDTKNICAVLDAKISTGEYPAADIRIRIRPDGIKDIIKVASNIGEIVQESTHVEDLAKPILDNKKQLEMLENYRVRLLDLQKKSANNVDALIKVSSELAKIQSEMERAAGEQAFLAQRVNLDIVTIAFRVKFHSGFLKPIRKSLSAFLTTLSDGISGTINAVAYLLPGAIVLLLLFSLWRYIKRRQKNG